MPPTTKGRPRGRGRRRHLARSVVRAAVAIAALLPPPSLALGSRALAAALAADPPPADNATAGGATCAVLALLPLAPDGSSGADPAYGRSLAASALLAVAHFNGRDPTVAPELGRGELARPDAMGDTAAEAGGCDATLALSAVDAGPASEGSAIEALLSSAASATGGAPPSPPCAVLRPSDPSAAAVSPVASALGATQLLYSGGAAARWALGAPSGGAVVSLDAPVEYYARSALSYLTRPGLDRRYVTLLYDGSGGSAPFKRSASRAAEEALAAGELDEIRKVAFFPSAPPPYGDSGALEGGAGGGEEDDDGADAETVRSVRRALTDAAAIGYRTVLLALDDPSLLPVVAREADAAGLLDGGRLWITTDSSGAVSAYLSLATAAPGSSLDRMLRGMAVVGTAGGFGSTAAGEADGEEGGGSGGAAFLSAWSSVDGPFIRELNGLLSPSPQGNDTMIEGALDFFRRNRPPPRASFVYDAIVALGMGLCRASSASASSSSGATFGTAAAMRTLTFQGASGRVSFDPTTGERDGSGVTFGMYNVRAGEVDADTGKRGYRQALTATRNSEGIWSDVDGEPFLYASGKTVPPRPLRDVPSSNYLSPSVRIAGLSLMALSLAISAGSALWVYAQRRTPILRAAQPPFLYVLCAGSAVTSSSIAAASHDEINGWSEAQLSAACVAAAWLFVLGHVIVYAALHGKLLRIHRVLQFRRRGNVKVRQVVLPFAALLGSAIAVLTAWTVADPLKWTRETLSDAPAVTCGVCMSDHIWAYVVPLALIMVLSTALTAVMAWRARDIPSEFQESTWIFYGVFAHLQSWVIGIPILVVLDPTHSSADASYLGRVLLVFIFAVSMVVLVIWPKMFAAARKSLRGDDSPPSRTHRSSLTVGGGIVRVSGLGAAAAAAASSSSAIARASAGDAPSRSRGPGLSRGLGGGSEARSTSPPGDALREAGYRISSLEEANESLRRELEGLRRSLARRTSDLEGAADRIAVLEGRMGEREGEPRSAEGRIAAPPEERAGAGDDDGGALRRAEEGGAGGGAGEA